MSTESSFDVRSWRVMAPPDRIESFLAKLRKEHPSVLIQAFRSDRAPNAAVIEMIAAQTLTAAKSGSLLAERREVDLLLRMAGTRQIGEAFKRLGYASRGKALFLVAASEEHEPDMRRVARRLSDGGFERLVAKKLVSEDLGTIERAALLAVRL